MDKLVPVGRTFFALALIGLGIQHFVFQEFIAGRAPAWPEGVPGGCVWAFFTGGLVVLAGAALLFGIRARAAALTIVALVFGWALLRHIPVLASTSLLSGAWTQAGKALVFVGGGLAIAGIAPRTERARPGGLSALLNLRSELVLAGRVCLGAFLLLTGTQHFIYTEFVASLIPVWFPGDPVFWAYFAGVALIAGGIGLFVPWTARLAGLLSGLMIFSWFWIVHLPRTFEGVSDSIAVFEALAVSGIALTVAGYRESPDGREGGRL